MPKAEHYKKKQKRDKISELLRHLKQQSFLTFSEMKALLNVSSVTLSSYLNQLVDEKKIEHCYKTRADQKKRKEGYRLKIENLRSIDSQIGKYEAIKFIEEMTDPIYSYSVSKDQRTAVAVFADGSLRSGLIQKLADTDSEYLRGYFEKTKIAKAFPAKTAFVIMFQKTEELKT